ncbi:Phage holin family 2 [compost metagenome]
MVVTLLLIPFPDAPKPVLVGAAAAMGILGEQVLELVVRRVISFKLGGDPK